MGPKNTDSLFYHYPFIELLPEPETLLYDPHSDCHERIALLFSANKNQHEKIQKLQTEVLQFKLYAQHGAKLVDTVNQNFIKLYNLFIDLSEKLDQQQQILSKHTKQLVLQQTKNDQPQSSSSKKRQPPPKKRSKPRGTTTSSRKKRVKITKPKKELKPPSNSREKKIEPPPKKTVSENHVNGHQFDDRRFTPPLFRRPPFTTTLPTSFIHSPYGAPFPATITPSPLPEQSDGQLLIHRPPRNPTQPQHVQPSRYRFKHLNPANFQSNR